MKIILFLSTFLFIPAQIGNQVLDIIDKVNYPAYQLELPRLLLHPDVTVTMYNPVPGQTDDTPNIVADGTHFDVEIASELRWIAVSRDLLKRWGGPLNYGDKVHLIIPGSPEKSGIYTVKDTMNPRFTDRVDILESEGEPIYKYEEAELYLLL